MRFVLICATTFVKTLFWSVDTLPTGVNLSRICSQLTQQIANITKKGPKGVHLYYTWNWLQIKALNFYVRRICAVIASQYDISRQQCACFCLVSRNGRQLIIILLLLVCPLPICSGAEGSYHSSFSSLNWKIFFIKDGIQNLGSFV